VLKNFYVFIFYILLFTNYIQAIEESQIPPTLLEWKDWVLNDVKDRECPINYQSGQPQCSWFDTIRVSTDSQKVDFDMNITLYRDKTEVQLPSSNLNWVNNVLIDNKKAIVLQRDNKPIVILSKGKHHIQGSIPYNSNLKYLQLPAHIPLVELYKDNLKITSPKIDNQSKLWLEQQESSEVEKGTLSVSIYRKVIDGHPLRMQTYLHLRVSGKMRWVVLDGVVLDGFLPTAIHTKLASTITEDKKLKIELKAGEWIATIDSYTPNNLSTLHKPKQKFIYANEEIWTMQTNPNYRTIKIEGVQSIDPSQTTLPKKWKRLPSYLVKDSDKFTIKELYKSIKQQSKNEFSLHRDLWLDFDGGGYTISDKIEAQISQIRRLEATNLLDLASVSINNRPTLITTIAQSSQKGVELRAKNSNIKASSRYSGDITNPPANGWDEKFKSISTILNLPPVWGLFASFGSDNKTTAWIDKWDLMDIFLVLLMSIAIYQLYGIKWAIPATVFAILFWHETDAPTTIWLFILALVATLRMLEGGRLAKVLKIILAVIVAITVLQVLNFSVHEIRTALYPQLEKSNYTYSSDNYDRGLVAYESIQPNRRYKKDMKNSVVQSSDKYKKYPKNSYNQIIMQNRIDPNAVVQTGIGEPKWHWHSYNFSWQSSVDSNERLKLWLISPTLHKIWNIVNIFGMLFLLYMLLYEFIEVIKPKISNSGTKAITLLVVLLLFSPSKIDADIPTDKMLTELKSRLTTPPVCLPNCSSMQNIELKIEDNILQIDISISAGANISVPLIGNRHSWLPQSVMVDNKKATNIRLDNRGGLWIVLTKGVHLVQLRGVIKGQQITLSSPLPIRNFKSTSSDLWRISSDKKSYIEISSLAQIEKKRTQKSQIEPLVEIKRTFYFGQRWYIDTEVKLLNRIDKPYSFAYPLLANESVLDKEIETKENQVLLHLENANSHYKWRSSLPISSNLELKAIDTNQIVEIWQMDVSSIWNIKYSGIEPISQKSIDNILLPNFKPWHSERLKLSLEKAQAVKGENLTIESSKIKIVQSAKYRDVTLNLKIKSSKASQYKITLKGIKEINPTIIDNQTHYLKISNSQITIPLQAKEQSVQISYREEYSSGMSYHFPTIDLAKESSNNTLELKLPQNRWILWTHGTLLAPAVLLWGVIFALLIFAIILGRVEGTPLRSRDWLLLGIGVSSSSFMIMLPIVIWIFTLRFREKQGDKLVGWRRNIIQVLLVILTIISISTIIGAVSVGLLGNPDMMIAGNGSYGNFLNWYSDRIFGVLPEPTVISVSIWYYRLLMLLWSIWVAFALIRWLKWAWGVFSQGDIWSRKGRIKS